MKSGVRCMTALNLLFSNTNPCNTSYGTQLSGNIRIVLVPESRKVEAHVSSQVKVRVNASEKVIAADAGLTEVFVDDEGNHYGKELGDTLKKASSRLNEKGKKRNKLHALAKKHDRQGKKLKARNIR